MPTHRLIRRSQPASPPVEVQPALSAEQATKLVEGIRKLI